MKLILDESIDVKEPNIQTPEVPEDGSASYATAQALKSHEASAQKATKDYTDIYKKDAVKEFLDDIVPDDTSKDISFDKIKFVLDESVFAESFDSNILTEDIAPEATEEPIVNEPAINPNKGFYKIKRFTYPTHYKMTIYVNTECDAEYHGFTSTGKRKLSAYPDGLWEEIEYRLGVENQSNRPLPGHIVGKPHHPDYTPYDSSEQLGIDYSLYHDDGTGYIGLVVTVDEEKDLLFAKDLCAEYGIGPQKA